MAASHQLVYLGISAAARTVVKYRDVSLVQNVGGVLCRGSGGQSPPEAESILDFYMHNFDLILNYFCFARATEIRHFI